MCDRVADGVRCARDGVVDGLPLGNIEGVLLGLLDTFGAVVGHNSFVGLFDTDGITLDLSDNIKLDTDVGDSEGVSLGIGTLIFGSLFAFFFFLTILLLFFLIFLPLFFFFDFLFFDFLFFDFLFFVFIFFVFIFFNLFFFVLVGGAVVVEPTLVIPLTFRVIPLNSKVSCWRRCNDNIVENKWMKL